MNSRRSLLSSPLLLIISNLHNAYAPLSPLRFPSSSNVYIHFKIIILLLSTLLDRRNRRNRHESRTHGFWWHSLSQPCRYYKDLFDSFPIIWITKLSYKKQDYLCQIKNKICFIYGTCTKEGVPANQQTF